MSFNYQDLAQLHPFNQLFAGEAETGPWCLHVDPQSSGFYGLRWINMYNKVCENKFLPIMLFSVNLLCFLSLPPTPSEWNAKLLRFNIFISCSLYTSSSQIMSQIMVYIHKVFQTLSISWIVNTIPEPTKMWFKRCHTVPFGIRSKPVPSQGADTWLMPMCQSSSLRLLSATSKSCTLGRSQ